MKRIKFLSNEDWDTGRPDATTYEAGKEYTLRNDLADRWLRRKKAELVEDLGPDVIPGADPEKVAEIQRVVEQRNAAEVDALADEVADAREALKAAL